MIIMKVLLDLYIILLLFIWCKHRAANQLWFILSIPNEINVHLICLNTLDIATIYARMKYFATE